MDLTVLLSSLTLVGVAELGDKSMFAVIALAARYNRRSVFFGAVSALILVSIIGALLGATVSAFVDEDTVAPFAALVFLAFGVWMLLRDEDDEEEEYTTTSRSGAMAAFSLITLMEMGDKTQIAIFTLAASSGDALAVIIGAALAFTIMVAAEVYLGDKVGKRIPPQRMRQLAGGVFIAFGLLYMGQWLL